MLIHLEIIVFLDNTILYNLYMHININALLYLWKYVYFQNNVLDI